MGVLLVYLMTALQTEPDGLIVILVYVIFSAVLQIFKN